MPPLSPPGGGDDDEPAALPSVLGVRSVSLGSSSSAEEQSDDSSSSSRSSRWSSEEAHAKWAVALGGGGRDDEPASFSFPFSFACVGDTNRDGPGRAGGAVCVRWPGLRRLLASAVEEVDACESGEGGGGGGVERAARREGARAGEE